MLLLNISNWNELLTGSIVGISVVFVALITLVLFFEGVQHFLLKSAKKKRAKEGKKEAEFKNIDANEIAAISMALHLFMNDAHDVESNVITIKRIERRYSPWSSKIYGINNTLIKR
jgi:Na+-transporting methylmalonyl-CoA/oxaloacetate decarboxylase gamma subunit